jgi:hypothetical protein
MKFLLTLLLVCNIAVAFDTTPQSVEIINTPESYKVVTYDKRYTFAIPNEYDVIKPDAEIEYIMILSKGKIVATITEWPASNNHLFNPAEYSLKDYTRAKLLSAIYDKNFTTNNAVNETRAEIFKDSSKIQVFKRDEFVFYKQTRLDNGQIVVTISSLKNDDILTIIFLKNDEEFLMNFIKLFKPSHS